jgi:hypothetical protein
MGHQQPNGGWRHRFNTAELAYRRLENGHMEKQARRNRADHLSRRHKTAQEGLKFENSLSSFMDGQL